MFTIISFFQKLTKGGGVGIRAGGLKNFSKINKRGGDDYSVLESIAFVFGKNYGFSMSAHFTEEVKPIAFVFGKIMILHVGLSYRKSKTIVFVFSQSYRFSISAYFTVKAKPIVFVFGKK